MRLIFDIEANGLLMTATDVFCIVAKDIDSEAVYSFTPDKLNDGIKLLQSATLLVGHNIVMYDLPVLTRILGLDYKGGVYDTLLVSRMLFPDRPGGHSLKAYGERVGAPKTEFNDFTQFSDEMLAYCIQDVKVAEKTYHMVKREEGQYQPRVQQAIDIEHGFAAIITKQIQSGFGFDKDKAESLDKELRAEMTEIYNLLKQIMPPKKITTHYNSVLKKNLLISETERTYTYRTEKTDKIVTKEFSYEEPNPTSRQQLANYLISCGWKPTEFTETGLPQVSETSLLSCEARYAPEISRMLRLQKMIGMISEGDNAWLSMINPTTERIHGDVITNACNTGRCSHSKPNISQVDAKDKRMRECWIPSTGRVLIGCDASSLELRVLAHYLGKYDKGAFGVEVVSGDIHTYNQKAMGLRERSSAKSCIYALIYGAGNQKLGTLYAKDQGFHEHNEFKLKKLGGGLRDSVEQSLTGYKQLTEDVRAAYKSRGYLIGIDGRPLHPRAEHSALNLLIQSCGAIIMKQALINFYKVCDYTYGVDYEIVGNIHDEIQIECDPAIVKDIGEILVNSIKRTEDDFKLKCEMNGEYKSGNSWAQTH